VRLSAAVMGGFPFGVVPFYRLDHTPRRNSSVRR
jgi:hypothetical protein